MKIEISNSKMKMPIGVENKLNRLMEDMVDDLIYELGYEIKKGIEETTGESISDFSYAFDIIADISEGFLFGKNKDKYFSLMAHIRNGLDFYRIEEIVNKSAERLGYAS